MKISAIGNYHNHSTNYARQQQQSVLNNSSLKQDSSEVAFKGVGKSLSSIAGAAKTILPGPVVFSPFILLAIKAFELATGNLLDKTMDKIIGNDKK